MESDLVFGECRVGRFDKARHRRVRSSSYGAELDYFESSSATNGSGLVFSER